MSVSMEEIKHVQEVIWRTLKFEDRREIEMIPYSGAYVKIEKDRTTVGGSTLSEYARAFTLCARSITEGKGDCEIVQRPAFQSCGAMLDVSRNGVMRVSAVKEYLNTMAALGMNLLMLYMEDTFTLENRPYFGHMRGRYTDGELREIDAYAASLGVEVVPCIQMLGHFEEYFKWHEADAIKDTGEVLLIGLKESYDFLEEILAVMRRCFRSSRIHIGMDEAEGVGLGRYLREHGYRNRFELLNEHLARVQELCSQYGFAPMMWSDMFFKFGSVKGEYYDPDGTVPAEVCGQIPEIGLVYWDYYQTDREAYTRMIKKHQNMGRPVVFAGGGWSWDGFLPNYRFAMECSVPALDACRECGVEHVISTMWGDDGTETNMMLTLPCLAIYSEYCYDTANASPDRIWEMSEFVTGMGRQVLEQMSVFQNGERGDVKAGKRFIWCDPLINLTEYHENLTEMKANFQKAYQFFSQCTSVRQELCEYASLLFRVAGQKCELLERLYPAYSAGDRSYLELAAEELLPGLQQDYEALHCTHKQQWLESNKAFGWEVLDSRYGAMQARLTYAAETILAYLNGEVKEIEELEEAPLFPEYRRNGFFRQLISASVIQ